MFKTKTKTIVFAGFVAIVILLVALMLIWMRSVSINSQRIESIARETREQELMFNMRDAAHKRALSLFRMAAMDDPFERDTEYLRFKDYATDFIRARDELLGNHLGMGERPIWERVQPTVGRGSQVQNQAVEMILDEHIADAHRVLHDDVMPIQESVMTQLTHMLAIARDTVRNEVSDAVADNRSLSMVVAGLASGAIIIVIFIATFVFRRTSVAERALIDQSTRLRTLYDTVAGTGLTLDEQINAMLHHGCEYLGLELAKVSRIDRGAQTNTFLYTYCVPGLNVSPGVTVPLSNTFCSIAVEATQPTAIANVSDSRYKDFPCHEFGKLECYIAAPMWVKGATYGTVNFAARVPRKRPFDERDIDLVRMIASWVGVTLERVITQQELAEAKDAAEAASRAKSAFVANMSHEIRTPLTSILGFTELLTDANQSAEQRAQIVKTIVRSGEHLARIINDILDLSKIESGVFEVESLPVYPVTLVNEVRAIMLPQAQEHGLDFKIRYGFPLPERIMSDPVRLRQILLNLCGNALKFTTQGSIELTLDYLREHNQLLIRVTDTGIGMTPEQLTRLFSAFTQADVSTTRRFGGTGLGLHISKQLARRLGGDISCTSVKDRGTRFEVTIAAGDLAGVKWISRVDDSAPQDSAPHAVPQLTGQVLLAEDNPEIQGLVTLYLRKTGVRVTVVDNGKSAVEEALQHEYDLVLMDMQMPIMDGVEATQWLRRSGYNGPIVSLTANALTEDRERCIAAGANAYISKPIDLALFYATLTDYMPRASLDGGGRVSIVDLQDDPEYMEMAHRFVDELPHMVNEIARSAEAKDWEALRSAAHKLKGLGGGFGFDDLSRVASVLQDQLRQAYYNDVNALVGEIDALAARAAPSHLKAGRK